MVVDRGGLAAHGSLTDAALYRESTRPWGFIQIASDPPQFSIASTPGCLNLPRWSLNGIEFFVAQESPALIGS